MCLADASPARSHCDVLTAASPTSSRTTVSPVVHRSHRLGPRTVFLGVAFRGRGGLLEIEIPPLPL